MTNKIETTRTCVACGQKKPLVAFLELAGTNGRHYGDLCAACRGAGLGQKARDETADPTENSGGTSRLQIDNKTRIKDGLEKKEQFKEQNELEHEEKTKKESTETDKSTQATTREKMDKKQREEYLELKNQSFLSGSRTDKQKSVFAKDGQALLSQNFHQEKSRVTQEQITNTGEEQKATLNEEKNVTSDRSVAFTDELTNVIGRTTGVILGRSAKNVFGRFREFLGKNSAIQNTLEQYQKTGEVAADKIVKETIKDEVKPDADIEYVRKNLKPR